MAVNVQLLPSVTPVLHYRDPDAAFRWLIDTLPLTESWANRAPDGSLQNAELRWRAGFVSINRARGDYEARPSSVWLTLETASEVDARYEHAVAAGAEVVRPLAESGYYFYSFTVRDPEGNDWMVGTDGRLHELRNR